MGEYYTYIVVAPSGATFPLDALSPYYAKGTTGTVVQPVTLPVGIFGTGNTYTGTSYTTLVFSTQTMYACAIQQILSGLTSCGNNVGTSVGTGGVTGGYWTIATSYNNSFSNITTVYVPITTPITSASLSSDITAGQSRFVPVTQEPPE